MGNMTKKQFQIKVFIDQNNELHIRAENFHLSAHLRQGFFFCSDELNSQDKNIYHVKHFLS